MTMFRGNAFGMELHAVDILGFVLKAHDDAICLGSDFKIGRKGCLVDDEGMITRGLEVLREVFEDAPVLVMDG